MGRFDEKIMLVTGATIMAQLSRQKSKVFIMN